MLGGFAEPTRSSTRTYGDYGVMKTVKLELHGNARVATTTAQDKQR
jgi:hypothetical protein